ncbi:hypothetical protein J6590_072075 [Homalodisca vitripennis]|nr:hypothetical protein J6590_072075 [Homalodisca vitripennis]
MLDIKGVMNTNTDVVENSNNLKTNVTGLANSSKGSDSNILDSLYFKFYNKKIQSALSQKSKLSVSSDITSKSIVKNQRSTRQRRLKCVDLPTLPSKSSSSDSENSQNLPCQIASVVLPDNTNSSVMKNSSSTKCDGTGQENDVSGVSENTVHLSSSESDSDFIDVPPSNGVDLCVPENKLNAQGLSIQINKDQNKIEDDIFADIFVDEKESAGKLVENINNPLPSNQIVKRSKDNLLEVKQDENKRTTKSTSIKIVQTSANLNSVSDESLTESFEEKQLSLEKEEEANVELNDARALLSNENEHSKTKLDVQDALIQQESEGSEDIDNPDLELKTPSKDVYKPEARSETSNSEALLESEPPKRKLNTKQLEKLQLHNGSEKTFLTPFAELCGHQTTSSAPIAHKFRNRKPSIASYTLVNEVFVCDRLSSLAPFIMNVNSSIFKFPTPITHCTVTHKAFTVYSFHSTITLQLAACKKRMTLLNSHLAGDSIMVAMFMCR